MIEKIPMYTLYPMVLPNMKAASIPKYLSFRFNQYIGNITPAIKIIIANALGGFTKNFAPSSKELILKLISLRINETKTKIRSPPIIRFSKL